MYFRLGGGSLKGVSKPGEIVWSRIFVDGGKLKADIGRAKVVELPREETERRWRITTPQWPIMHAVLYGVSRDQLMARHKSNHVQVAYAPDANGAIWPWPRRPPCSAKWGSRFRSAGPITACRGRMLFLQQERRDPLAHVVQDVQQFVSRIEDLQSGVRVGCRECLRTARRHGVVVNPVEDERRLAEIRIVLVWAQSSRRR